MPQRDSRFRNSDGINSSFLRDCTDSKFLLGNFRRFNEFRAEFLQNSDFEGR